MDIIYIMTRQKRSCYITCKYCEEKGDSYNHKSTECSDAYPYIYKNGLKCLDDCSKEELYIDKTTNICYDIVKIIKIIINITIKICV